MLKPVLLSLSLIATALSAVNAYAEQLPLVSNVDGRVHMFNYNPHDVFVINAKVGYSGVIQLEDDEIIHDDGGIGMGDAKAWSLAVKGNNIFFKPIADLPDTNMLLVTNKRTYAFELTTKGGAPTYIARFNYPDEDGDQIKEKSQERLPKSLQQVGKDNSGNNIFIDSDINTSYQWRGDAKLKPSNAWDDGRFTFLRFDHADDLPTVYRVLPDGSEVLVNTHTDANTLILHEVGYLYRLRFGKAVTELGNQNLKRSKFNTNGTSDKNYVRIDN